MTRAKRAAIVVICIALSFLWSYSLFRSDHDNFAGADFRGIYYGARCVMHGLDPYNPSAVLREFNAEGGRFPTDPLKRKVVEIILTMNVNMPTALFLAAPFALLPLEAAKTAWMALIAVCLAWAAYLLSDLEGRQAPGVWAFLAGITLLNCEISISSMNSSGIVVGLCIAAAWCFLKRRFEIMGVLLLAISLAIKPHDSGFVWLYFLLAGGTFRKRALQTLAVTGVLGLLTIVWLQPVSPHWLQELQQNNVVVSAPGGTSDPALDSIIGGGMVQIIDLQATVEVFERNFRVSQFVGLLIACLPIAVWIFLVLRKPATPESSKLALAAISALTMLPIYHRPYDAKLLLLAIPACAMLWTAGGVKRWTAMCLTCAGILAVSDVPQAVLLEAGRGISTSTLAGKFATVLFVHPAPLILLGMGCFYLWELARYRFTPDSLKRCGETVIGPTAVTTT